MKRAIMVLAASLLVGWTSAAAAQCAWVLWAKEIEMKVIAPKKTSSHGTVIWTLESAFEPPASTVPPLSRPLASRPKGAFASSDTVLNAVPVTAHDNPP